MKKQLRQLVFGSSTVALMLSMAFTAGAAWQQDASGWKWQGSSGKQARNEWIFDDSLGWFHFDGNGYMQTGWFQDKDGSWYYLNPISNGSKGKRATGWVQDGSRWYFMDSSGAMLTGLVEVDGQVYYLNPVSDGTKGVMKTGSVVIDGVTYTFDENGAAYGTIPLAAAKYNGNGSVKSIFSEYTVSGGSVGSSGTTGSDQASRAESNSRQTSSNVDNYVNDWVNSSAPAGVTVSVDSEYDSNVTITITSDDQDMLIGDVISLADLKGITSTFYGVSSITFMGQQVSVEQGRALFDAWYSVNESRPISSVDGLSITASFGAGVTTTYTINFQ